MRGNTITYKRELTDDYGYLEMSQFYKAGKLDQLPLALKVSLLMLSPCCKIGMYQRVPVILKKTVYIIIISKAGLLVNVYYYFLISIRIIM